MKRPGSIQQPELVHSEDPKNRALAPGHHSFDRTPRSHNHGEKHTAHFHRRSHQGNTRPAPTGSTRPGNFRRCRRGRHRTLLRGSLGYMAGHRHRCCLRIENRSGNLLRLHNRGSRRSRHRSSSSRIPHDRRRRSACRHWNHLSPGHQHRYHRFRSFPLGSYTRSRGSIRR